MRKAYRIPKAVSLMGDVITALFPKPMERVTCWRQGHKPFGFVESGSLRIRVYCKRCERKLG